MKAKLDHVVFGCLDLAEGEAELAASFGAPAAGHGTHAMMSTHNALWNMGDAYIELVAIDPAAPDPGRPRWFGLDKEETKARLADGPCLLTWIVATEDAAAIARAAPIPFGAPGLDGVFPGPIEWITGMHPAQRLGDQGIRCEALTLTHPQIEAVGDAMRIDDPSINCAKGPPQIGLTLSTPNGAKAFHAFD